jgi:hypothetical protein
MKLIFVNFVPPISGVKSPVLKSSLIIILVKPVLLHMVVPQDNLNTTAVEEVDVADVVQALEDHLVHLAQMVCPDKMVHQDNLVMLAEMEQLHNPKLNMPHALIVHLDLLEDLEMLAERVPLDTVDNLAVLQMAEDVDLLDLLVVLDLLEELVDLDKLADLDLLVPFEMFLAQWDHLAQLELPDNLDNPAVLAQMDIQVHLVALDNLVMVELLVALASLVLMVIMDQMVTVELVVNVHIVLHHVLPQVIKLEAAVPSKTHFMSQQSLLPVSPLINFLFFGVLSFLNIQKLFLSF